MRSVYVYVFFLNFGYTYSRLKDVGEVTNFSLYIDSILENLAHTKLKIDSLLHGGTPAKNWDLPYNVLFLNYLGMCGGVIISNAIVLTCAHCLDTNKNLPDMRVFAGARYLFDPSADVYEVWDFIVHKDYNEPIRFSNDAALLIIHGQFKYKSTVQKALLVNNRDWMQDGAVFRVSGWADSIHGENETVKGLQSIDLNFVPHYVCKEETQTRLSPDMFCLSGDGERGFCRGDSGGAAMLDNYVVGLASHDVRCEENPGIYINVYYLRPWIELASKKLYYKYCYHHMSVPGDY